MKFRTDRKKLEEKLNAVAKAVSNKPVLDALAGIRIQADENGLVITGGTMDIMIQCYLSSEEVHVSSPGDLIFPLRIAEIVRKITADEIVFESVEKETLVFVHGGKSRFRLSCIEGTSFPNVNFAPSGDSAFLTQLQMKKAIEKTLFAASIKETYPASLNGIHFIIGESVMKAEASDRYRYAATSVSCVSDSTASAVLPVSSLKEIARLLAASDDCICKLILAGGQASAVLKNKDNETDYRVWTRVIDAAFPDTSKMFSDTGTLSASTDTNELKESVERVLLVCSSEQPYLQFAASSEGIRLRASSKENGDADELTEADVTGDAITAAVSGKYLAAALKAADSEKTTIIMSGELRPVIIVPEDHPEDRQVILPVKTK